MSKRASNSAAAASSRALLNRKSWPQLPAICVLVGNAGFFKTEIIRRFVRELSATEKPEIKRFPGPASDRQLSELPLSTVLDELRTLSFLSSRRLVIVEGADAFVDAYREVLEPYVADGFSGGHLILLLERRGVLRTRFGKAVAKTGWVVDCAQLYDRPPPWDKRTPVWDSDLSHWVVDRAKTKGLKIDPRAAFVLHERVGNDLGTLDEELEKIATLIAAQGDHTSDASRIVTEETILAISGELREDSIFKLVDLILEGRRRDAAESVERLFERGYHNESGALVVDPAGIALPFIATSVNRLRNLRRAHAMGGGGGTSEDWIREKLVQKPFLSRFQRQLRLTPPQRIQRLLDRLFELDRSIKRGGDAHRLMALLVVE